MNAYETRIRMKPSAVKQLYNNYAEKAKMTTLIKTSFGYSVWKKILQAYWKFHNL